MKINPKNYGGGAGRPSLTPEDLHGKKAAVVTIAAVESDVRIPDTSRPAGYRVACVLSFDEFTGDDDRALYLNKTQVQYLCDQFGDETDEWVGQRLPLEVVKVNDVRTGKPKAKVYVAEPGESWDGILASARGAKRTPPRSAARRPVRRGR